MARKLRDALPGGDDRAAQRRLGVPAADALPRARRAHRDAFVDRRRARDHRRPRRATAATPTSTTSTSTTTSDSTPRDGEQQARFPARHLLGGKPRTPAAPSAVPCQRSSSYVRGVCPVRSVASAHRDEVTWSWTVVLERSASSAAAGCASVDARMSSDASAWRSAADTLASGVSRSPVRQALDRSEMRVDVTGLRISLGLAALWHGRGSQAGGVVSSCVGWSVGRRRAPSRSCTPQRLSTRYERDPGCTWPSCCWAARSSAGASSPPD